MFSLKGEALDDQRAALGHYSLPETRLFPGTALLPDCAHEEETLHAHRGHCPRAEKNMVSIGRATSTATELHKHYLEKFIAFPFLGNVDSKGIVPLKNT